MNLSLFHRLTPLFQSGSRLLVLGLTVLTLWGQLMPAALAQAPSNIQPYIDRVKNQITEFTLDNGMKFIVMERHQAPIVSFETYVNIGSAYEQPGKTGAAHFLEHLAFKGTDRIGTTNYRAEKPLLDRLDQLFDQIQAAKAANRAEEAAQLQQEFDKALLEAASFVRQNEYGQIVEQAGGVGLNAATSADATMYFYSFPSNKLELWMSLESERFLDPVFREFYEEKDVILEERRMRTDNSPIGKMIEQFLETALPGHPYGRPVIGSEADLRGMTRQDIIDFFDTHYTPDNIVATVVGDVDPDRVKELAQAYFGRYKARSSAPEVQAALPKQTQPKEVTLRLPTQPWYMEGYQRPAITDRDEVVYQVISSILGDGRTSRLYKSLVLDKQLALDYNIANSFPGDRYSNLMLIYALTAPGHTVDEIATVLDVELERLKTEPVTAEELDRVKTQTRAGLLQTLASNQGMAGLLAEYEAKTGSWENLFNLIPQIEAVTEADVQRVAQATFRPDKKTIGKLLSTESPAP
ncbi:M16 family metallopeptidase [Leptolyngbya ohadii]|uniref:M16 family metallopeptidase n=1 Tax=Leptolyngbya ohadii TaxID=1962290 RepID=UPI00272D1AA0|nr:pitrilysin family protein [Leptolyngbya ohadii]